MAQISKRQVKPEVQNRLDELFTEIFAMAKSPQEAASLLFQLLTKTGQTMLTKRLAIGLMLMKGFGYETIDKTIKVSYPTINKVKEWMSFKGQALTHTLERLIKRQKIKELFNLIYDSFEDVLLSNRPGSNWAVQGRLRRAVKFERNKRDIVSTKL